MLVSPSNERLPTRKRAWVDAASEGAINDPFQGAKFHEAIGDGLQELAELSSRATAQAAYSSPSWVGERLESSRQVLQTQQAGSGAMPHSASPAGPFAADASARGVACVPHANERLHNPAHRTGEELRRNCDSCVRKKVRCGGGHPCRLCARRDGGSDCTYSVKRKPGPKAFRGVRAAIARGRDATSALQGTAAERGEFHTLQSQPSSGSSLSGARYRVDSERALVGRAAAVRPSAGEGRRESIYGGGNAVVPGNGAPRLLSPYSAEAPVDVLPRDALPVHMYGRSSAQDCPRFIHEQPVQQQLYEPHRKLQLQRFELQQQEQLLQWQWQQQQLQWQQEQEQQWQQEQEQQRQPQPQQQCWKQDETQRRSRLWQQQSYHETSHPQPIEPELLPTPAAFVHPVSWSRPRSISRSNNRQELAQKDAHVQQREVMQGLLALRYRG